MICKEIVVFVALVAAVAAVDKEGLKHPNHHHGHVHHSHSNVTADFDVAPTNLAVEPPLAQEEIVAEIGSEDINKQEAVETQEDVVDEEESDIALEATLKSKQQEPEDVDTEEEFKMKALWADCDYEVIPRISCFDCQTRLICKYPGGGKLIPCYASAPYCNNGICSTTPSAGCA